MHHRILNGAEAADHSRSAQRATNSTTPAQTIVLANPWHSSVGHGMTRTMYWRGGRAPANTGPETWCRNWAKQLRNQKWCQNDARMVPWELGNGNWDHGIWELGTGS